MLILLLLAPAARADSARYAALVIDAVSGEVFHQENADRPLHPASLTKLMTLYLTFKAIRAGQISLDTAFVVSAKAADTPPSRLGLPAGATIRVREAINALVVNSANDIAVVVAEGLGGSEDRFAQQMTAEARRLGMTQTTFRNASGLPNSGQISSARDMARLAQALIRDFPEYFPSFAVRSWEFRGRTYRGHNRILTDYPGADGMKTGYIRASGFNLVATATRGRLRLIGVVFGGESAAARDTRMAVLLDAAFQGNRGEYLIAQGTAPFQPPIPLRRPEGGILVASAAAPVAPQTIAEVLATAPEVPPSQPLLQVPVMEPPADSRDDLRTLIATIEGAEMQAGVPLPPDLPIGRLSEAAAEWGGGTVLLAASSEANAGAVVAAPLAVAAGWSIQVGAYNSRQESEAALTAVAGRVPDLLAGLGREVSPVQTLHGQMYRARFVGFDDRAALAACERLAVAGVTCLAIAPDNTTGRSGRANDPAPRPFYGTRGQRCARPIRSYGGRRL